MAIIVEPQLTQLAECSELPWDRGRQRIAAQTNVSNPTTAALDSLSVDNGARTWVIGQISALERPVRLGKMAVDALPSLTFQGGKIGRFACARRGIRRGIHMLLMRCSDSVRDVAHDRGLGGSSNTQLS